MEYSIPKLLDRLQDCDECQRLEAKASKTALGKSALDTIAAFSNEPGMGGGYGILGLTRGAEDGMRYS